MAVLDLPMTPIPDATRKRILTLDMHDLTAREIAAETGIGRTTVESIINRTRGMHRETHRGDVTLLHDPAGIFMPGARFNADDMRSWARYGEPAEGMTFQFLHRNGSVSRRIVRGGQLIDGGTR